MNGATMDNGEIGETEPTVGGAISCESDEDSDVDYGGKSWWMFAVSEVASQAGPLEICGISLGDADVLPGQLRLRCRPPCVPPQLWRWTDPVHLPNSLTRMPEGTLCKC